MGNFILPVNSGTGNAFSGTVVPKSFKFSLIPTDSVILDHAVHTIRKAVVP
jgi:hypothetical protein